MVSLEMERDNQMMYQTSLGTPARTIMIPAARISEI